MTLFHAFSKEKFYVPECKGDLSLAPLLYGRCSGGGPDVEALIYRLLNRLQAVVKRTQSEPLNITAARFSIDGLKGHSHITYTHHIMALRIIYNISANDELLIIAPHASFVYSMCNIIKA